MDIRSVRATPAGCGCSCGRGCVCLAGKLRRTVKCFCELWARQSFGERREGGGVLAISMIDVFEALAWALMRGIRKPFVVF